MSKKYHRRDKTRLTSRNAVETLNDVLRAFNYALPEDERHLPVKTPRDLCALRLKLSAQSQARAGHAVEAKSSVANSDVIPPSLVQALSTIATNTWRARHRIMNSDNGDAKEDMKRVVRHIDAVFDALSQIGVEVRDMQGRPYDAGMALKVISFEPTPGLSQEEVSETIKPTITWEGKLIQMGEVIVGIPQVT